MAVLKSPRNSRQKIKWAGRYALRSQKINYKIEERKSATIEHKLNLFLRNKAHWVVSSGKVPSDEQVKRLETAQLSRNTPLIIRYGSRFFDSTRPNPTVLRAQLRRRAVRENLLMFLNSTTLL